MTDTSSTPTPPASAPASGPVTSLEQLVAARQQRGLSVSDVAAKLGMVPRQIEALERADWNALPGQAFVRGAVRAYGKALQLDIDPLLSAIGGHAQAADLRPSSSLEAPLPKHGALGFANGGSGSKLVWILLGVIGVIAIALYFGRSADFGGVIDSGSSSVSNRAVETVPLQPPGTGAPGGGDGRGPSIPGAAGAAGMGAAPGAAGASGAGGETAALTGAAAAGSAATAGGSGAAGTAAIAGGTAGGAGPGAAAAGTQAAGAPAAGSPAVPSTSSGVQPLVPSAGAAAAPAASSSDALRFTFERESWVDVRDAAGSVLLFGTQPAQSTREVQGRRPYTLIIGNAGYVRLERSGQPIDLKAPSRSGVARLTVD